MIYVITRHDGAVQWLVEEGFVRRDEVQVIDHMTPALMEQLGDGDILIGVLPLDLAAQACERGARVVVIALPKLTREMRGRELTADDMRAAGAQLREYQVRRSQVLTPEALRVIAGVGQ